MNSTIIRLWLNKHLSALQIRKLRRLYLSVASMWATSIFSRNLTKLSAFYGAGKPVWYLPLYDRHFRHLRRKHINILEIGIGGYDAPMAGGGSLRMWKTYFPSARVFGLDIFDKDFHNERRIKTIKGSQVDLNHLTHIVQTMGEIDIIIDDGSHQNEHVITSFTALFPYLKENGIYVVEDTQTSYWDGFGGSKRELSGKTTMMQYFKVLADEINYEEITDVDYIPTEFASKIVGLHFYHNILFIEKGRNNQGSSIRGTYLKPSE